MRVRITLEVAVPRTATLVAHAVFKASRAPTNCVHAADVFARLRAG